jgi:hypothetical protein
MHTTPLPSSRWSTPPVRVIAAAAITALMALAAAGWAVNLAVAHHPLAAATTGAWATVIGSAITAFALMNTGSHTAVVHVEDRSISVHSSRGLDIALRIILAGLLVAGLAGALTLLRHGQDLQAITDMTSTRSSSRQQTRLILASVLALLIGAGTAPRWLNPRLISVSITLTPTGIQCGRAFSSFSVDWDEIVDVTDRYPARRPIAMPIVFHLRDGRQKVWSAAALGAQATNLYPLIRDYHANPHLRAELGNGQVAQRLGSHTHTLG